MASSPIQALFQQALVHHRSGRLEEAEKAYRQIMRADPRDYPSRCMLGRLRMEQGRNEDAEKVLESAVKLNPQAMPGLGYYGVALLRVKKYATAVKMFERGILAAPDDPTMRRNLGDALRGAGQQERALAAYDDALARDPGASEARAGRALSLLALSRLQEALDESDRAIRGDARIPHAHSARAQALAALGRRDEAIDALGAAVRLTPDDPAMLCERADLLADVGRFAEAIADYSAALTITPRDLDLLRLRAHALKSIRRFDLALVDLDAILAQEPKNTAALFARAGVLDELGAFDLAITAYDRYLALKPDNPNALHNRSRALVALNRYTEAAAGLARVVALEPDSAYAYGGLAQAKMHACDWTDRAEIEAGLRAHVVENKSEIHPGTLLGYLDDPALQRTCAEHFVKRNTPEQAVYNGPAYAHDKIRVAYISADFHSHATARLVVELFERHDRNAFAIEAVSFGAVDETPLRARCVAAFDAFHEVTLRSDEEIAALLRQREIDIAVDLKGFTAGARAGVFARRPAPIQVNYLAAAGTMGAAYLDYFIADKTVAPMSMQPCFTEQIVHLPDTYQPNDSTRPAPQCTLSRAEAGLPDAGFVFCSFNNSYKITPAFFDIWMRLLHAVDGAVLWLLQDSEEAKQNLRKEAAVRGVDPARLVFAPRVSPEDHLARHRLADLFLDTLPCGAHTTASDALWMALPVVTSLGNAFAGRVCASLCRAANLDELVTEDIAEYERLALSLARDPARLAELSARLERDRLQLPLFDSARYTRAMERAYTTMITRYRSGLPPAAFAIQAI